MLDQLNWFFSKLIEAVEVENVDCVVDQKWAAQILTQNLVYKSFCTVCFKLQIEVLAIWYRQ